MHCPPQKAYVGTIRRLKIIAEIIAPRYEIKAPLMSCSAASAWRSKLAPCIRHRRSAK